MITPLKLLILILWVGSIVIAVVMGNPLDPILWALWSIGAAQALSGILPGP